MKILSFFLIAILAVSMVSAIDYGASVQASANVQAGGDNTSDIEANANSSDNGIGSTLSVQISEKRDEFKSGNFTTSLGKFLSVNTMVSGLLELRDGDVSVKTELNITKVKKDNEDKLEVKLRNGRNAEIKIMPSVASETALAKLRVKACNETNNCAIELKEVGTGDNNKVEYTVQLERHSKILGIFQKKMQVSADVDAETGMVIGEHKPWWAFMATEPAE